jgi:hypothetical protein
VENDTNYYGVSASFVPEVASIEDCQQLCAQDTLCAVGSYQPSSLGCWLKAKGSFGAPSLGMFSIQKYCPGFGE